MNLLSQRKGKGGGALWGGDLQYQANNRLNSITTCRSLSGDVDDTLIRDNVSANPKSFPNATATAFPARTIRNAEHRRRCRTPGSTSSDISSMHPKNTCTANPDNSPSSLDVSPPLLSQIVRTLVTTPVEIFPAFPVELMLFAEVYAKIKLYKAVALICRISTRACVKCFKITSNNNSDIPTTPD